MGMPSARPRIHLLSPASGPPTDVLTEALPLVPGAPATVCDVFQFCEILSAPEMSRWAGPIIDVLLDYVGNVHLCSRLKEHIDSFEDWAVIKEKAGRGCCCCCRRGTLPDSGPGLGARDCYRHLTSTYYVASSVPRVT